MSNELTPPDNTRCQALIPTGHSFMTLGPRKRHTRCESAPSVIVTETKPGEDGQQGSMSLCSACLVVMQHDLGPEFATVRPIVPFEFKKPEDTEGGTCD